MYTDHEFLRVKEVADLLQLNPLTIYEYIRSGKLSAVILGRSYRVEKSALKRFITRYSTKGTIR